MFVAPVETQKQRNVCKIQIVTRHFRIQFLSRNIKVFNFITFLKLECY